jgi:hypothetical protein
MFKARGSQQPMILFPMERGRNTLVAGLTKLQIYPIHLFDNFILNSLLHI